MHTTVRTLKPLNAVYRRFITGDSFRARHCIFYEKVGWTSLTTQREHCLFFIYKANLNKLQFYLSSLLRLKYGTPNSQECITLDILYMNTELG